MKKGFIESKLEKSDWNIAKSAELLGISKEELSQQMAAFGLRQN
jgi:transcriptional regulator with GAF, ATPase, and Fis domain